MAFGIAEDPALSITPHLDAVEYPVTREQLAMAAADKDAHVDIINLFKSLPQEEYQSRQEVMPRPGGGGETVRERRTARR